MTRRLLLMLPLAAGLRADTEKEVRELIASAVSGLSAGDPGQFLAAFDAAMEGFSQLREDIKGLVSQADVSCSIEVTNSVGDDDAQTLTLDWIMRLDFKDQQPNYDRREKTVTCKLRRTGKTWRIVSFDPLSLFKPAG
jgi:hypothetical protein